MANTDTRPGDPRSPTHRRRASSSSSRTRINQAPGSTGNPEDRLVDARELEVVVLRAELEVGGPRANGLADAALRRGEL
jgi:hypothetical protein